MTFINMTSVNLYLKIQNILGSSKIIACVVVILGGLYELARGDFIKISNLTFHIINTF